MMAQTSKDVLGLAAQLRETHAGNNLTPAFAKLYSQYTRLKEGQPGLSGWRENEEIVRLNDAIRLLEIAFIERDAGNGMWRQSARRAAEILEWLSDPYMSPYQLSTEIFSAAAYQLAGYPARAFGLLNLSSTTDDDPELLRLLLAGNFPDLFSSLANFWEYQEHNFELNSHSIPWQDHVDLSQKITHWIAKEVVSSIGIICAFMRWGDKSRLESALAKLNALSKFMLHGVDPYSWLLAKLSAEVAIVYIDNSLRKNLVKFTETFSLEGKAAIERYLRLYYLLGRTQMWPSQLRGIKRLTNEQSFTLCTPTGSGKTTVAEMAILQNLFSENKNESNDGEVKLVEPIVIYLVPSRALAAEVEMKLSQVLHSISDQSTITVTGLYGGTDWGPTDAWLTTAEKTVLICTYEKTEALLRFLGPIFLHRVSLVIIDEAHYVQFDGKWEDLQNAENRSLRLEVLATRLISHINNGRFIALSAMASNIENPLAGWIAKDASAEPEANPYRSTRQLIGRLECLPGRRFEIRYDLLDGASLAFREEDQTTRPFIPSPFPPYPPAETWETAGPEKRLRPYLFWAALHLAMPDEQGRQRSVLISITQGISGYAKDFLELLEEIWEDQATPTIFTPPNDNNLWNKCLLACEDYFTKESREYRLLEKGVIVHHGRMPGTLSRFLVMAVQRRLVHLVLATSTLTEGVNLPFETILIPSLRRWSGNMTANEFGNLAGRAGRPGYGTEGRTLVLLSQSTDSGATRARNRYLSVIRNLQNINDDSEQDESQLSPLAALIIRIEEQWQLITGSNSPEEFLTWLEQTAPLSIDFDEIDAAEISVIQSLDTLDSVILAAITEIEQLSTDELNINDLEQQLTLIWQKSFAYFASQDSSRLEEFFVKRGLVIKQLIYPDQVHRKRLYLTSLPPRSGNELITLYPTIREFLERGDQYALWDPGRRFDYIRDIAEQVSLLSKFSMSRGPGTGDNRPEWSEILLWWLNPRAASRLPTSAQISAWHSYVNNNFYYRFNWGLGCIISLANNEIFDDDTHRIPTIEDWPETGLPWIVFWIKELIVWGTLDPVAAFLLARGICVTRSEADEMARVYYETQNQGISADEILNAVSIRDWAKMQVQRDKTTSIVPLANLKVELLRNFESSSNQRWRVVPVEMGEDIQWLDPAGFPLAACKKPESWDSQYFDSLDFVLNSEKKVILSDSYYD